MLKRMNKTIALIVAATTVISTIPVMASEKNKIERLNESDGGITNAVAFSDGKYIYQGSKADQDYGVYYNDGTKDTKLDDVDDLDEYTKYGDSSIIVPDGNSEQKINLTDGTVSEDGDRDDALVTAETKLEAKLSKTNRYGSHTEIKSFTEVSNDKFGDDVWYAYTATGNSSYYSDITAETESESTTSSAVEYKSEITVTVNYIWGDCTIGGKSYSGIYNVSDLRTAVLGKDYSDTDYTVESATLGTSSSGDATLSIIFATTEDLGTTVPDGFVSTSLTDWTAGNATAVAADYVSTDNEEPMSQITVTVNYIWGDCTIGGKSYSGIYNVSDLRTAVLGKDYSDTDYTVESATLGTSSSGDATLSIIFTTTENLGTTVPDGFVSTSLTDWTAGNATSVAADYVSTDDDTSDGTDAEDSDSEDVIYYGYCDSKGNYIDCSKIANIRVYNGETVVRVENFNDEKTANDVTVKLGLPTLNKTLGQDANYIYNLIEVPVIGYQPLNGTANKADAESTLCYVQKISKAQDIKDGGAYLPKDVESYYLSSDCGWDGGDNWAYTAAYYMLNDSSNDEDRQIRIIDGNIYAAHETTYDDGDKYVTFAKLKLRKTSKITPVDSDTYGERGSIIQPIVYEDFANDTKIGDDSSDTDSGSWTIDAKGNAWAIYNGRIKMSGQGYEWQDMYRCAFMNRLSVYDDTNLIAWEDGGDVYVTVKDGEIAANTVTKTGWQKAQDGSWHLYDLTGKDSKGWVNYSSCWYYFNDQGAMQTGWVDVEGKTYYLASTGVRLTGWVKVGEEWYYLDESGVKQVNTTIDGYKLDSKGVRGK